MDFLKKKTGVFESQVTRKTLPKQPKAKQDKARSENSNGDHIEESEGDGSDKSRRTFDPNDEIIKRKSTV